MTPDERASLQATGNSLAQSLMYLSISVLFSGVCIGLSIVASLTLLNRGLENSWPRWAQPAALLTTLLTSVVSLVQPTAEFAIQTLHLNSWSAAVDVEFSSYGVALNWTQQIGLLVNDIVVIWRAWILYPYRPGIRFLSCLPFCATLATGLASLALVVRYLVESHLEDGSFGAATHTNMAHTLNNAAIALSLTTNLFATTLIFLQFWRHRIYNDRSGLARTSSQRIMLVLVEAGFIFCIGQAAELFVGIYLDTHIITQLTPFTLALKAFDNIFWSSTPMYLPVVILLAENNRTISEYYFSFDSSLLADAVAVEAAGRQEGGPESFTTYRSGTARASAHESDDNSYVLSTYLPL